MHTMWVLFDRVSIQKVDLLDKSIYCNAGDKRRSIQVCRESTEFDAKWGPLGENRTSRCYEIGHIGRDLTVK